jgi:hypothetical protein
MSEIRRFKGCNVRIKRDEFRPNSYVINFEGGLGQMRGMNNPAPQVPPSPEALVEIDDGQPNVRWRVRPSNDDVITQEYTEEAKKVALEEHNKAE